mgnify:FL=1
MTQKEVREKILHSTNPNWFRSLQVSVNLPHVEIEIANNNFTELYQYISKQVRGWKKINKPLPGHLNKSQEAFDSIKLKMESFLENSSQLQETQLNNQWNNSVNPYIQNLQSQTSLTYDSSYTSFLIDIFSNHRANYDGAYDFIINKKFNGGNNVDYVTGSFMAYEFLHEGDSVKRKRRNAEKSNISRLKNDFELYFKEGEKHVNEFIKRGQQTVEQNGLAINSFVSKKSEEFETWFGDSKTRNDDLFSEAKKNKDDLLKTYSELLKLKAPAQYWETRAKSLRSKGEFTVKWLIALVVFGFASVFSVLWLTPDGMLLSFIDNKILAIKWSIVFVTFLSFLAYGIKILAKISFSSYHLASDAEERKQLTYLYLSLKQDGNVEESDRQLILQSLFSRADTGLLKDDGAPTMPGASAIVEKIIKPPK